MARWKLRGYVQDSEEDEETSSDKSESQKHNDQVTTPAGFLEHFDDAEDAQVRTKPGVGNEASLEKNESNMLNAGLEHAESRIPDATKNLPLETEWDLQSGSQETDELQDVRYQTQPKHVPRLVTHSSPPLDFQPGFHPTQLPPSSPLTLPPSSPINDILPLISPLSTKDINSNQISSVHAIHIREDSAPREPVDGSHSPAANTGPRARSLRHRNPIQLHPYAIESEKYRQTLKGSGFRPLRIGQVESRESSALQDVSQDGEIHARADSQDELLQPDSMLSSLSSNGSENLTISYALPTSTDFDLDEGELPDVEAILRGVAPDIAVSGYKRRRVTPSIVGRPRRQHAPENRPDRSPLQLPSTVTDNFHVPLSPPRSQTSSSLVADRPQSRGFRVPRGFSPAILPTPVASSEPRRRGLLPPEEPQPDIIALANGSSESEREDSANETQAVNYRQLERVQRKMRGVLPASWLKLDFESHVKRTSERVARHEITSPNRDVAQRGVARPVISRNEKLTAANDATLVSSSSSEGESGTETERTRRRRFSISSPTPSMRQAVTILSDEEALPLANDLWGEVSEDNRIDAMLPSTAKRKGYKKLHHASDSRKRQTRLTDAQMPKSSRSIHRQLKESGSQNKHQPHLTQRSAEPRKPKFRPPNLSLLDIPSLGLSPDGNAPSFIRLARRVSRSRNDQGKSGPSRKYLRMTSEVETADLNEYLRSWQEGSIHPSTASRDPVSRPSMNTRIPLQPCTGNHSMVLDRSTSGSKGSVPEVRKMAKVRSKSRVSKPPKTRSIQTTLRSIIRFKRLASTGNKQQAHQSGVHKDGGTLNRKRLSRAGYLTSSLKESDQPRPATLESLQARTNRDHMRSNFRNRLEVDCLDISHVAASNPLLEKYLEETDLLTRRSSVGPSEARHVQSTNITHTRPDCRKRAPRKRKPRRVVAPDLQLQRDHEQLWIDGRSQLPVAQFRTSVERKAALAGLGASGTVYTTSFDITPFLTDTCFTERTFIGSGDFEKSFVIRDLDQPQGFFAFQHGLRSFRWGAWDDRVSTQLTALVEENCESLEQLLQLDTEKSQSSLESTIDLLKQLIRYPSTSLSFHDPIDRHVFLQRFTGLLNRLSKSLTLNFDTLKNTNLQQLKQAQSQAMCLCTVLAGQLLQISKNPIIPRAIKTDTRSSLHEIATKALDFALIDDSAGVAQCLNSLKRSQDHCLTLKEGNISAETLVIASIVLEEDTSLGSFWQAACNTTMPPSGESLNDARVLETYWRRLFIVLPFLEVDRQGVVNIRRRHNIHMDNWTMVKALLEPVFEAYESKTHSLPPTINSYCRALFDRCFELIDVWKWHRCESIIGVLFDFFARRGLFHLPNEESRGSPHFLSQLGRTHSLKVAPEDRCFHILLKIIGMGLQRMEHLYSGKKIRDIAWRLMPNHGRFLPKDQAIRQTDLDALRNHHDLLCTLYWASPSGFRPRPMVIQNLVDVENSHKEACRINVRAWSNLVTFQLTTNEPLAQLEHFAHWWNDLLRQILRQHQNARTEAEEQARLVESTGATIVNRYLLESTIAQNQRQVEAMLSDVILSMKNAVSIAADIGVAITLLTPDLPLIFDLFSTQSPYTNKVIAHALDVLIAFANKASPSSQTGSSAVNDDSQDYGDWPALEMEVLPASLNAAAAQHLEQYFQNPLRKLLSSCFGADNPPGDTLLTKVVDAWVAIARVMIQGGRRAWTDYVGGYGQDSWASLRDTEQTRKFSAYYLAILVESDEKVHEEHRQAVLKSWASSLVERELLLKFHHRLTNALLNGSEVDAILTNPPFWTVDGRYQVTAFEFSERRLSLISNMLSNMRKSVEGMAVKETPEAVSLKANYKEILKVMMNSMKINYQQLGHGSDIRGAYVDFVHRIVELLQQHTSSICPIDRFFTDSGSFPLPAADPTYVVGQLKSYGMRLHDHRTPKQLAVFIQSVSERAAMEGQQKRLVEQLYSAMITSSQSETLGEVNLRSFLLTAIFPAYLDLSFNLACGWIMALPVLQALRMVLSCIMTQVNGCNSASLGSTSTVIVEVLRCLLRPMDLLIDSIGLIGQPKTLKLLAAYFAAATASLPALDYVCRVSRKSNAARALVKSFKSFGLFAAQSLLGQGDIEAPDMDGQKANAGAVHGEVQMFSLQELKDTLTRNWVCHEGQYYVNKGLTRREVVVDLGLFEEEKAVFIKEVEKFINALDRMSVLR
ncbi:MAG: hypothetical protein LQ341_001237 [Variospora aurantia]|nr:MAG: hypothetical protein LQ341_001237 [Variospora aurantia]